MALYVNGSKVKVSIKNEKLKVNINTYNNEISSKLLSSDNFVLKDMNGLFLIAKDGE